MMNVKFTRWLSLLAILALLLTGCQIADTPTETDAPTEAVTDAPTDAAVLKEYWSVNRLETQDGSGKVKKVIRELANKVLNDKSKEKIRRIIAAVKS